MWILDDAAVYRIVAKSENGEFYLELDVPTSLYSMLPGEKYRMVISNSLHLDGSDVSGYFPQVTLFFVLSGVTGLG